MSLKALGLQQFLLTYVLHAFFYIFTLKNTQWRSPRKPPGLLTAGPPPSHPAKTCSCCSCCFHQPEKNTFSRLICSRSLETPSADSQITHSPTLKHRRSCPAPSPSSWPVAGQGLLESFISSAAQRGHKPCHGESMGYKPCQTSPSRKHSFLT